MAVKGSQMIAGGALSRQWFHQGAVGTAHEAYSPHFHRCAILAAPYRYAVIASVAGSEFVGPSRH